MLVAAVGNSGCSLLTVCASTPCPNPPPPCLPSSHPHLLQLDSSAYACVSPPLAGLNPTASDSPAASSRPLNTAAQLPPSSCALRDPKLVIRSTCSCASTPVSPGERTRASSSSHALISCRMGPTCALKLGGGVERGASPGQVDWGVD